MKNLNIVNIIRDRFEEQKMSAEYKLQLAKVCELEDKFIDGFSKDKWKEYFNLDIEKGQLHSIETNQLLDFCIEFIRDIKL